MANWLVGAGSERRVIAVVCGSGIGDVLIERTQEAAFLRALETWANNFSVHIDNKFDSLQVLK